jgi:hypothetical protein
MSYGGYYSLAPQEPVSFLKPGTSTYNVTDFVEKYRTPPERKKVIMSGSRSYSQNGSPSHMFNVKSGSGQIARGPM